jgi:predicted AAA+ superfamily ATPase
MFDKLKEIILSNQAKKLNLGTPRDLSISTVSGKATICIGVRRGGKSTYMLQLMQKLFEKGVSRQNIVQINFFDNRLHELQHSNLEVIIEAYYSIYPDKKNSEKVYYFFDEIQDIQNWEPFIERLLRSENCEVYITGSSAKMLSKEIATQMRGRSLAWEIFPFSLAEYLNYKDIKFANHMETKTRLLVQQGFAEYLQAGSFPEVAMLQQDLRIKIHQEYFNTMLFRDLIERHNVKNPLAVTDTAYWLINNTASSYTINSLTGHLKSLNHKITKDTVGEYIDWLEDAFFLFSVRIFDASLSRANANPKKIYCIDHALVTSVSSGILVNSGHLLENLIYITLRRITEKIYYYRTRNNREVDFIAILPHNKKVLIQVSEALADPKTQKRELSALREAMEELHLDSGIIVTLNEEKNIEDSAGTIRVVPAWKFLLYDVL